MFAWIPRSSRGMTQNNRGPKQVYVCLCYGISNHEVQNIIQEGALTVEDVQQQCGAGLGCGCCLEEIKYLIEKENAAVLQGTKSSSHASAGKGNSQGRRP
jgi:bacterioferritin-associated ferredoxin